LLGLFLVCWYLAFVEAVFCVLGLKVLRLFVDPLSSPRLDSIILFSALLLGSGMILSFFGLLSWFLVPYSKSSSWHCP
jgi:preprotein translocase subunit SecY